MVENTKTPPWKKKKLLHGELVVKYYLHTIKFALVFLSTTTHSWFDSSAYEAFWKSLTIAIPMVSPSILLTLWCLKMNSTNSVGDRRYYNPSLICFIPQEPPANYQNVWFSFPDGMCVCVCVCVCVYVRVCTHAHMGGYGEREKKCCLITGGADGVKSKQAI